MRVTPVARGLPALPSRRTVVAGAGNNGGTCPGQGSDGYVNSPATASNVIAVGAYGDLDTVPAADDGVWPCSGFRDPVSAHGDREEPELVAPGDRITSLLDTPPWGTGPRSTPAKWRSALTDDSRRAWSPQRPRGPPVTRTATWCAAGAGASPAGPP